MVTYPLMTDSVIPVAISAHPAIRVKLVELYAKAEKHGIQALNRVEWCLMIILRAADKGLKAGSPEVDLRSLSMRIVDDLKDEGVELWQGAFSEAADQAIVLFTAHPDSQ